MNPEILVYVAGPFSARTRHGVDANIARAVAVGLQVAKLGLTPVIPHANTAHPEFEKIQPYPFWIAGTTEILRRCDAMVMVPDKENTLRSLSKSITNDAIEFAFMMAIGRAEESGCAATWCTCYEDQITQIARYSSWRDSSGALREREEATRLVIPIFNTVDDLGAWTPVKK